MNYLSKSYTIDSQLSYSSDQVSYCIWQTLISYLLGFERTGNHLCIIIKSLKAKAKLRKLKAKNSVALTN